MWERHFSTTVAVMLIRSLKAKVVLSRSEKKYFDDHLLKRLDEPFSWQCKTKAKFCELFIIQNWLTWVTEAAQIM